MKRILIAHSNPQQTAALVQHLQENGWAVVQAADTSSARRELCAADYSLALLHPELPGGAWDFWQKLQRHPELRSVPVAALTTTVNVRSVLLVIEHGLAGFVSLDMPAGTASWRIAQIVQRSGSPPLPDQGGSVAASFRGETITASGDRRQLVTTLLDLLSDVAEIAVQAEHESQQRRKTQRELVESEARKTAIFEAAIDSIIVVDEHGVIREFNTAAERRFGCPRSQVVGHDLAEHFIPQSSQQRYRDNLQRYTSAGEMGSLIGRRQELEMQRLDGERFIAEFTMQPFPVEDGTPAFAIFLHDITARRKAETQREIYAAELKRSNRDLADFAHAVSHDLQEPLRAMTSYCQLVHRQAASLLESSHVEYLESAIDAGGRMKRLLQDLLAYSRVSTRGREFQPVDLNVVLRDAAANLEIAIEEAGATINPPDMPLVKGEKTQLMQLFQNLMGNAIKFRAEPPPVVTITCHREEAMWRIAVADNGIGIPAEHVERVFTIFQRLHDRQQYAGTGIGLALCKRIVERHGGEISVTAGAEGKGSTFEFTLPACELPHNS